MDHVVMNLQNLAGGAAPELFDAELDRVLRNIEDRNTDAEGVRKITLEVVFKPAEDRVGCDVDIKVSSKLAGITTASTKLILGKSAGKLFAVEHDPKQLLLEMASPVPPAAIHAVDRSKGDPA